MSGRIKHKISKELLFPAREAVADAMGVGVDPSTHRRNVADWSGMHANVTALTSDTVQEAIVGTEGGILAILLVRSVRAINKL